MWTNSLKLISLVCQSHQFFAKLSGDCICSSEHLASGFGSVYPRKLSLPRIRTEQFVNLLSPRSRCCDLSWFPQPPLSVGFQKLPWSVEFQKLHFLYHVGPLSMPFLSTPGKTRLLISSNVFGPLFRKLIYSSSTSRDQLSSKFLVGLLLSPPLT